MYLVSIAGGHAAGKRTVAHDLAQKVASDCNLEASDFSRLIGAGSDGVKIKVVDLGEYQLTQYKPDVDFARLRKDLEPVPKSTIVFVHGLYALYDEQLNDQARLKIYIDADADVRLSQWILRDQKSRQLDDILQEYLNYCRPEFSHYIERTKSNADVILPQGSEKMTIELLAYEVRNAVLKKLDSTSPSVSSKMSTPMINLRAEVASNAEDLFYSAN